MSDGDTDNVNDANEPSETDDEAIKRLSALPAMEYDRLREAEAKKLGVRISVLDDLVRKDRQQDNPDIQSTDSSDNELIEGIQPWCETVNGPDLANEIRTLVSSYCILPRGADIAITLWCLSSYSINNFRIYPKLCLSSPEKRCGKTTTLEVIGAVVDRGLVAANMTSAVLFRISDMYAPSLLIDEADSFIHGDEALRGIINSGHTKSSAFVWRVEGDSNERKPVKFSTFVPMCIAMIKTPPDTIVDRSIMAHLRRKMPGETVKRLPIELKSECTEIRRRCKRWAEDHARELRNSNPVVPQLSNERAMDNWGPLLSVADELGGDWPGHARAAMLTMESVEDDDTDAIGPAILADIKKILGNRKGDRIKSSELVDQLVDMEERPWCEWKRGKPMTTTSLARLLKPYKIKSRDIRDGTVARGYLLKDFEDSFSRYLDTPLPQTATTLQANKNAGCSDSESTTPFSHVAVKSDPEPMQNAGCSVVAFDPMRTKGNHGLEFEAADFEAE